MKLRYFYLVIALVFLPLTATAQTKVGTVDTDLIAASMPEFKTIQAEAQKYNDELEKQLQDKLAEYEKKAIEYQKGEFNDVMKKVKEDELIRMQNDINQFKQNAVQMFQLKQQELLRPLFEKITQVIAEIAKAENYSQILNLGGVELAYSDPAHDLTQKVMTKLGIKQQ
ncbi:MAG: OmpH family outer membrane protein [Flavobacteriaceae bacterium]|nr:OmpH family outer membrane protein [Flavobacteriaceae bacterium]